MKYPVEMAQGDMMYKPQFMMEDVSYDVQAEF